MSHQKYRQESSGRLRIPELRKLFPLQEKKFADSGSKKSLQIYPRAKNLMGNYKLDFSGKV